MRNPNDSKKIIDITSYNDRLFITYSGGEKKSARFSWYFYIHNKDVPRLVSEFRGSFEKYTQGKEYTRVYNDPFSTRVTLAPKLHAAGIQTYEADFSLEERFKYDYRPEIDTNIDILYIDIETDDRNKRIEIGRDFILSVCAEDSKGKKFKFVLEDLTKESEKKMLIEVAELFKKYIIISGWNIDGFDIPYLRGRCQLYNIKFKINGSYDLFTRCKHIYRNDNKVKSFSLNNFAKIFLDDEKEKYEGSIFDLWQYDQKLLIKYNKKDVDLCKRLDEKLKITNMMLLQCQWCRVIPRKFSIYQLLDSYIIQISHSLKRPVPTNLNALEHDEENNPDKYLGAEVLEPEVGVHSNTYVFDFKQLYPSLIMTFNIGFDSLKFRKEKDDDFIICAGTQHIERKIGGLIPTYFSKEPSCVAEAVKKLSLYRDEYKKLKLKYIEEGKTELQEYQKVASDEIVVKELITSVYGIMGLVYGRYYSAHIAESITLSGRWMLNFAKKYFEKHSNSKVIYGDTDSLFVKPNAEFDYKLQLEGFHKAVKEELFNVYNCVESRITLNFDKHFTKFILFAKKTYAGHADSLEGKTVDMLYEKGMDYIKRNTFKWAGDKQKELLEDILRSRLENRDVVNRIRKYKSEFLNKQFSADELKITQRVNQDEYKTDSVVARLVTEIKEKTGISPIGTEIFYIITPSRTKKMRGVLLENYEGIYSRDYYWEHKTRPLLDKILQVVAPGQKIDVYDLFLEA